MSTTTPQHDRNETMKTTQVTIKQGATAIVFKATSCGLAISARAKRQRANPQRARITEQTAAELIEVEERGIGEFAHKWYTVRLEGRILGLHERHICD
jgi:hypothetical protein